MKHKRKKKLNIKTFSEVLQHQGNDYIMEYAFSLNQTCAGLKYLLLSLSNCLQNNVYFTKAIKSSQT